MNSARTRPGWGTIAVALELLAIVLPPILLLSTIQAQLGAAIVSTIASVVALVPIVIFCIVLWQMCNRRGDFRVRTPVLGDSSGMFLISLGFLAHIIARGTLGGLVWHDVRPVIHNLFFTIDFITPLLLLSYWKRESALPNRGVPE
jgi:hypothetical protein